MALQVLKQVYVADRPAGSDAFEPPVIAQITLSLLAAGVILLGCAPEPLIHALNGAIQLAGF